MKIGHTTQLAVLTGVLAVLVWLFKFMQRHSRWEPEKRDDLVVGSFSTTDWYNDARMVELVSYLCNEGISASYEKLPGPAGVFNYQIKAPKWQADRAKALLQRRLRELQAQRDGSPPGPAPGQ